MVCLVRYHHRILVRAHCAVIVTEGGTPLTFELFRRKLLAAKGASDSFRKPKPFTWLGAVGWFIVALSLGLSAANISERNESRYVGIAHSVFVCVTLVGYSATVLAISLKAVRILNKSSLVSTSNSEGGYNKYLILVSRLSFGAAFCIFIHGLAVGANLLLSELWLRNLDTSDALRWSTAMFLILYELTDNGLAIMFVSLLTQPA